MVNIKRSISRLLLIVIFLLFGPSAYAIGVGVKPEKINLDVKVGQNTKTEILVINVAPQPAIYQIYPDGLEKEITISPNAFQLDPNGTQIVQVAVQINTPGKFVTTLSIVARPLGAGGLTAASGVKMPVIITASGIPFLWIALGIIMAILVALFFLQRKYSKTPQKTTSDNF